MSETGLVAFDRTLQKTHQWLKEIAANLRSEREVAYVALRATLHTLRDRLPIDAAVHFGAQLPMLVRGIYYEGYKPAATPTKERSEGDFLEHLRRELRRPELDPSAVVAAVLAVVSQHVSA